MTRDDIIRMAREAGDYLVDKRGREDFIFDCYGIERFANLVAAAERERIKWNNIHSCHADCQNPACVIVREAVATEREACAAIAFNAKTYIEAAKAIRARGKE